MIHTPASRSSSSSSDRPFVLDDTSTTGTPTSSNGSYFDESSPVESLAPTLGSPPRFLLHDKHDTSSFGEPCVLVTGGLGFIGSHTVLELLLAGYKVHIVDNLQNSKLSVLGRIMTLYTRSTDREARLEYSNLDYRDTVGMTHILTNCNIISVIHFAAFKAVAESLVDPMKYYRNNVSGFIDFIYLLRKHDIRTLIYSSSATVYGTIGTGLKLEEQMLPAGTCCQGISNAYGRSKWMCEAVLADLCRSDARWQVTALRYFNPVGAHPSGLLGEEPTGFPNNLMPVLSKVLLDENKTLKVFGTDWDTHDGSGVRDFIHVVDLAKGHVAALNVAMRDNAKELDYATSTGTPGKVLIYNLGSGTGHSVLDIVHAMQETSGLKIAVEAAPRRDGDFGSVVASADAAYRDLGWKTSMTLRDICADTWRFLSRKNACAHSVVM